MTAYTPRSLTLTFPAPVEGPPAQYDRERYSGAVVVDFTGRWLLIGAYDSPREALARAVQYARAEEV